MKNIKLLFVCMCLFISVQAQLQTQKVTVVDQNTLQPLSNVQIFKANEGYPFAVSGEDGIIQVKDCAPSQEIYFRNPNFELNFTTLEKLKSVNYTVKMIKKFNEIDEIVVSASRFEENKKDVSQKIQVLSAREIQDMNQSSTADVLANSGNVMVQKSQLGGGSPIIRGFETNKVLIVVDGVRMNNAIYRGGHLQNVLTLDNAIMDRVEIVYGPGSVVYGSDALGGVMSFTTKNPLLSYNDKLKVKSSAYTRYMSAVSGYAAHADVSVGGKKFGSLTSFTYSKFGDLRQGANRAVEVGNFGARTWYADRINGVDSMVMNKDTNLQVGSGYSQYDILQKFLFQQNAHVKHTLNLQYSSSSNIDRYDRLTLLSGSIPKFAEWYYGPQKRLMTSYSLELSKATKVYDNARLILAYQQIEESRIDRKFKNNNLNNRIENLDVFTLNLDFLKYLGNHELRYGIDGWFNNVNSTAFAKNIATGAQSPLDTRYASGGATMQSIAVYATDKWIISDKIIVNSGLRYSNVGLNAKFTDTTFFNFPFKVANQSNNALTGNIGLIYKPSIETRLIAIFSTGFRAPNVDDLSKVFESTPGYITVPNSNLKSEYTYNGEVGITHSFSDALNIQVNGYYTWYRNALTTQNFTYNGQDSILYGGTMSQVVATTNANKAFLYGLELAINGRMNYSVGYYATYNYTHARIVSESGLLPLGHIPPIFGKFGIQVIDKRFKGDLFVNYSGAKNISDYSNSGEDNQDYALPTGMPAWFTVNAKVNYQFNKFIGLQVACENILDQNYRVFASNISAPGRNFIVTLRGNF
jgi:hemoglobin/transferrin/lactoferrin receptor protein